MAGLSCVSAMIKASSPHTSPTSDSSPLPPLSHQENPGRKNLRIRRNRNQNLNLNPQITQKLPKKPSITQIERAIGSGSYRDSDTGEMNQSITMFDALLGGEITDTNESSVEKKLREIGEMFSETAEAKLRSSGRTILMVAFRWILPIWTFSLLVACGIIKLPFSVSFLDDLIM